jgi:CheY-like chemotaxis protein
MIKHVPYLIGKGFLSTYDINGSHQLLFLACVDGTKNITSIKQVKFYVSKMVYEDRYKAVQLAVKDLVAGHSGDVIMCNSILDYVGEKITLPRGGSLPELMKYKQVVVRTCLSEVFSTRNTSTDPLVVESNHGTVAIHTGDSVDAAIMDTSMDTSDIIRALRELTPLESNDEIIPTFTASVASADIPDAISRGLIGHAIRYTF